MLLLLSLALLGPGHTHNCSAPLGLADGRIRDAQLTASSSYQENLVGPEKANLFYRFIFSYFDIFRIFLVN